MRGGVHAGDRVADSAAQQAGVDAPLHEVILSALLHRPHRKQFRGPGAENDDRDVGLRCAKLQEAFELPRIGEREVKQNTGDPLLGKPILGLVDPLGLYQLVVGPEGRLQHAPNERRLVGVVFD